MITPALTTRQQRYLDRFTDTLFALAEQTGGRAAAAIAADQPSAPTRFHKPDISGQLRDEFQQMLAPIIANKNAAELADLEVKLDEDNLNLKDCV
jgi:hypothetical protein